MRALVLIPGFMLYPADYSRLMAMFDKGEIVDVWPAEEEVGSLGHPGTGTYEDWMNNAAKSCECALRRHPDAILLFHSAGAEIYRRMDIPPTVTPVGLGCKPVEGAHHVMGWMDTICAEFATPTTRTVPGGHFNCVTQEGMQRCRRIQVRLGGKPVREIYTDASKEIAQLLRNLS